MLLGSALPCAAAAPETRPAAMLAHHHEQSRDMADAQCVVTCPLAQAILSHPEGASPALSTLRVEFEEAVAPWRGVVSSPRPPPPR